MTKGAVEEEVKKLKALQLRALTKEYSRHLGESILTWNKIDEMLKS